MSHRSVGIEEAIRLREAGATIVDVREPIEWQAGHVSGAVHIPLGDLPARMGTDLPDRDAEVLLYCRSGARSGRASDFLAANGYTNVVNVAADIAAWRERGGGWEGPAAPLTPSQARRYARQTVLPEVGEAGQRRLLQARVLVVGAGALGSPAGLYLAASGVGTIGIADDDRVEESNLQRQLIHGVDRIGQLKVDSAERSLRALHPELRVIKHAQRIGPSNADEVISGYDVVVDGTDNFEVRYALNDAAVRQRRPVVHGSVYRWEGQVTTLVPFEGPCYRCIHPVPPPDELAPDCATAGVLGVLPGVVGTLQAAEVVKLVLGVGEPLVGRLLVVDALGTRFDEVRVPRDPACVACGSGAPAMAGISAPA